MSRRSYRISPDAPPTNDLLIAARAAAMMAGVPRTGEPRMNRLLPWLPGLLLLAGAAPQDDIKTELAKLEGTWATLYVEIDGKELKADVKNDRLVIAGTNFTFTGSSK